MLVTGVDRGSIKKMPAYSRKGYICKTSFIRYSKQSTALIFVIFIAMTITVFEPECLGVKSVCNTIFKIHDLVVAKGQSR